MFELMNFKLNDDEKSAIAKIFEKAAERVDYVRSDPDVKGLISELQAEVEHKDKLLQTALHQLDIVKNELAKKQECINDLVKNINEKNESIAGLRKGIEASNGKIVELQKTANSLYEETVLKEAIINGKSSIIDSLNTENEILKSNCNRLNGSIEFLARLSDNLALEKDNLKTELQSLQSDFNQQSEVLKEKKGLSENCSDKLRKIPLTIGKPGAIVYENKTAPSKTTTLHAYKFHKNATDGFEERIKELKEFSLMIIKSTRRDDLKISLDDGREEYFRSLCDSAFNDNLYCMRGMMFNKIICYDLFDAMINNELKKFLIV